MNLNEFPSVYGALVLGQHALYFAKGGGVDMMTAELNFNKESFKVKPVGEFTTVYRRDPRNNQSFLMVGEEGKDGLREVHLKPADVGAGFSMDLTEITADVGIDAFAVDPGLMAVIAPTRWGKSTVLFNGIVPALGDRGHAASIVNFLEVYEDPGQPYNYTSREDHLLAAMLAGLIEPESVVCVDSIRAFVYGKSVGGTGTAGLDQYMSVQLTALSNMYAVAGSLLILTINPMVSLEEEKDIKRYNEIADALVASTTLAFVGQTNRMVDLYPRGFLNPSRDPLAIKVKDYSVTKTRDPERKVIDPSIVEAKDTPIAAAMTARRLLANTTK